MTQTAAPQETNRFHGTEDLIHSIQQYTENLKSNFGFIIYF